LGQKATASSAMHVSGFSKCQVELMGRLSNPSREDLSVLGLS
jgi:hypothetical protein